MFRRMFCSAADAKEPAHCISVFSLWISTELIASRGLNYFCLPWKETSTCGRVHRFSFRRPCTPSHGLNLDARVVTAHSQHFEMSVDILPDECQTTHVGAKSLESCE